MVRFCFRHETMEAFMQNDGLSIQFRPDLSKEYPWTVFSWNMPFIGFATRERAEQDLAARRALRAAGTAKAAHENKAAG